MSFGTAESARARGDQIRHRPLMLQQGHLGKSAATPTAIPNRGARLPWVSSLLLGTSRRKSWLPPTLETRQSFFGEGFRPVDQSVFAVRSAYADTDVDIVF